MSAGDEQNTTLQFWDYAAESLVATESDARTARASVSRSHATARSWRAGAVRGCCSGTRNPRSVATLEGHSQTVTAVAFAAEGGLLVTGSSDQTVRLWDASAHLRPAPRHEPRRPSGSVPRDGIDQISTHWPLIRDPVQFVFHYAPAIRGYSPSSEDPKTSKTCARPSCSAWSSEASSTRPR